ncbi:MAG TPA: hypothetical protein VHN98_09910 [Acidimicrobiales bacterium]|nr:hypothetical protein [Acidimicrobiales bacterium]
MLPPELRAKSQVQYGSFSRLQAHASGLDRYALRRRVATGDLERRSPRVFHVAGTPYDARRPLMEAVLDGGTGTYVTRRSAAALWRVPGYDLGADVEVTRRRGSPARTQHLGSLYPLRYLPDHLVTKVAGIPVVTLPLVLFQLAGFEHPGRVERALDTIVTKSPATLRALHALLPELAKQGRDGIVVMRSLLEERPVGSRVYASNLERRFATILEDAGEPPLERQVDVGGADWIGRVDFIDRELRALFEVQSDTYHTSVLDMRLDAERFEALRAAGWRAVEAIREEWIWHSPDQAVEVVRRTRRRLRGR